MKNKVLATLLAVCLFAGLAVPAFADYYSSVEGDATKASIIDFYDGSTPVKEITLANGDSKDIASLVRVFEDKNTLILDKSYLNYTLEGNSLAFGINGSTINCIDNAGTTTVVVTSTLDEKVVGKLTVKAKAAAVEKFATGFRFVNTSNTMIVGTGAEASKLKISSVPAGTKFTTQQIGDITAALNSGLVNAMSHVLIAGNAAFNTGNDLYVTGLRQNETIVFATAAAAVGATPKTTAVIADKPANDAQGVKGKEITVTVEVANGAVAAGTVTVATVQAAIRKVSPAVTLSNYATGTTTPAITTIATPVAASVGAAAVDTATAPIISVALDPDSNDSVLLAECTNDTSLLPAAKKTLRLEVPTFLDGNNQTTTRNVVATTSVQNIKAVPALNIGGPGTVTIEVGQEYKLGDKLAFGPSGANVAKDYTLVGDYNNSDAVAMDYAAVDGGKILGVKVGTNRITASLNADTTKTATIIINVVAKGTMPAPATGNTTVLSAWAPKLGVGETANIVVKADGDVTYKSLNEAVATVDAAGKITAVKEGVAKISVQEEGKDMVYLTVTVGATTTKPEDKPTDVPQTAVAALVALF